MIKLEYGDLSGMKSEGFRDFRDLSAFRHFECRNPKNYDGRKFFFILAETPLSAAESGFLSVSAME